MGRMSARRTLVERDSQNAVARLVGDAAFLVLAPHPDDELLGAGLLLAMTAAAGAKPSVVILTDGSASHQSTQWPPERLAAVRRDEARFGLARLGIEAPEWIGIPDGQLAHHIDDPALVESLVKLIAHRSIRILLVPDPADDHPDHRAAFRLAVRLFAAGHVDRLVTMPIGLRVDGLLLAPRADHVVLNAPAHVPAKTAALFCHASQFGHLVPAATGFTLPRHVMTGMLSADWFAIVDRADQPVPPVHFDSLFNAADPWNYAGSADERARFDAMAELIGRHPGKVLEIGCGAGHFTDRLAQVAQSIAAVDPSAHARRWAAQRLQRWPHVTVIAGQMPDALPRDTFDTIVASDVLYYQTLAAMPAMVASLHARLQPGGRILISNYRGETEAPMSGAVALEAFVALAPWARQIAEAQTALARMVLLERIA